MEAHKLQAKSLILSVKEELHTSHANQGYDQFVAKEDTSKVAETLYTQWMLTRFVNNKGGIIDQWDLVYTTISLVRSTTKMMWVSSYSRVNLHPNTRVSFHVWCRDRIARFLQAGEAFYPEAVHPTAEEIYSLLPEFLHGMTPEQKKEVHAIFLS